eukprot:239354_1
MELLIHGYMREFETKCCMHIPYEIQHLIVLYYPKIRNPFGEIINDFDIQVSYDVLSAVSEDKHVTMEQFIKWINKYLQLGWDNLRIKTIWNTLDSHKRKYITFKQFQSGLSSMNSDVVLFYSSLMSRDDVHPNRCIDQDDWKHLPAAGRIKRIRAFVPRYLRMFSRQRHKTLKQFQKFLL